MKFEKKGMCCGIYIVLVNGKLAKNATMDPVLFFFLYYNQQKHHLYSCAGVDTFNLAKKDYAGTGI